MTIEAPPTSRFGALRNPAAWAKQTWSLLAFVVFIFLVAPTIDFSSDYVSSGDHASNSMLVVQAKKAQLLHGNYSRVGFYHPGPYFLYVMAAGELLLHDGLRIARSPESAHRAAIAVSHLLLLGVAARLFSRYVGSSVFGAAFALLALGVAASMHPILTSTWPPHTYIPPAILFAVALWRVIDGDAAALWGFALGGGVLVHGHASNIGLVPIMGVAAFGAVIAMRKWRNQSIEPRALWRWTAPHFAPAVVVFGVFLGPYLLHTVLNWPGETPSYFKQAGGPSHSLSSAAAYTFAYWGAWPWAVCGALIAGVIFGVGASKNTDGAANAMTPNQTVASLAALAAAFAITTAAMIFYASKGVDYLSETYIGFWYVGAVSAFVAASLAIVARALQDAERYRMAAPAAVLGAMGLTILAPPPWATLTLPGDAVDAALVQIEARTAGGIAELYVDNDQDWGVAWPIVAGLIDRAIRKGEPQLCIAPETWHLVFHRANRCETTGSANTTPFLLTPKALDDTLFEQVATAPGIGAWALDFDPGEAARLQPDARPTERIAVALMLKDGWHAMESDRVWQDAPSAHVSFNAPPSDTAIMLELSMGGFVPEDTTQTVIVTRGAERIVEHVLSADAPSFAATVEIPPSSTGRTISVGIEVDALRSPSEWGSGDTRRLGVFLNSIRLREPAID